MALVLHPTASTYTQKHPGFDPFTVSDNEFSY